MFEELYWDRGSIFHNLDLRTKVWCLLVVIPIATFIGPPLLLVPILLLVLAMVGLSRVTFKKFWKKVRLYSVSLTVGIIILSLIFSSGDLVHRFIIGLLLSAKFLTLIGSGVLFTMITDPMEFPTVMMKVGIPHMYGVVIMVAYRMLPLIGDRINNIVMAQRARGAKFSLSSANLPRLATELMSLMVPVVYITLETSTNLSDTLLSRGYDPNSATITVPPNQLSKRDVILLLFFTTLLITILFLQ